jgi:hypothetical protein
LGMRKRSVTHERVEELLVFLSQNPSDLAAAEAYWNALGNVQGVSIRSGQHAVEAFGEAALGDPRAAVALASAYKQLSMDSGERPRRAMFSGRLLKALRAALSSLEGKDRCSGMAADGTAVAYARM